MTTANNDGNSPGTIWCYSKNADGDGDIWDGRCDSREAAILDGSGELDFEDGETSFFIHQFDRPKASEFMPSAKQVLEIANENAMDDGVSEQSDPLAAPRRAEEELDAFLTMWADRHVYVGFARPVGRPERIELREASK